MVPRSSGGVQIAELTFKERSGPKVIARQKKVLQPAAMDVRSPAGNPVQVIAAIEKNKTRQITIFCNTCKAVDGVL